MKTCRQCNMGFKVTDADRAFYQKMDVPEPALCPDCRMQQLTAFRNEMNFHWDTCALTGKKVLTSIPPGRGYKVVSAEAWYGEKWDPLQYGRDIRWDRPFLEQVNELIRAVPHMNLVMTNSENCDYCNYCVNSRNCYLCARVGDSERCLYSYLPLHSFDLVDSYYVIKSQIGYEAIDCKDCYNVFYSQRLNACRNVWFSLDCTGCEDCFGCYGLRHKKYHFFNQPLSKEAYFSALEGLDLGSHAFVQKMREKFYREEVLKHPLRHAFIVNAENAVGDYIQESRNVYESFDVSYSEDVRHSSGIQYCKDVSDGYANHYAEDAHSSAGVSRSQRIRYCYAVFGGSYDLRYSMECFNGTRSCFGCVGLNHKEYCILNRQYTKAEYEALVPRLIEHMQRTGEYGEFFPLAMSPFAYNETVAGEYFPMTQAEAVKKGLYWHKEASSAKAAARPLPDHIRDVKDDILEAVLTCERSGRPYRILPQELAFYRQHKIPIPRLAPYERHLDRVRKRGPRHLFARACAKCKAPLQTTYAPDRPEIVYCEACYLKEVY